jgi:sporulation protein YlmC with PRC-barrel domain
MAEQTKFAMGATASCSDGACGEVSRMIIDPATLSVTHLVIEPKHRGEHGRLVPLDLVDTSTGETRLRCTLAEFGQLEPAEETELLEGAGGTGVGGMATPMGISHASRTDVQDLVPRGETEVGRGEHVHALDGEIGQVEGFLVDPGDHRVTQVLLREGHLWGRKEVVIPVSAVTRIENGIRLNLTKQQIEDLPSAD